MIETSKQIFRSFLLEQGLKSTRQREIILDLFLKSSAHSSTEELYLKIRRKHPNIGYATVHRTLKLFAECGIAAERNFGDGTTRYEATHAAEHHDHLICTSCGAIFEFEDPKIEQLQQQVAERHGFTIISHRLELYGACSGCQNN
jgi:Fur family transcriptional regulator, ferric uptake regulator